MIKTERCFLFNTIRLFRIRAASERVARGFAPGMIVNFLPTFGFGVLISGFCARAFGGNVIAGLVGGASLAFARPLLFYLNLRTGNWLPHTRSPVTDAHDLTEKNLGTLVWGQAFSLGAFVNSLIAGVTV